MTDKCDHIERDALTMHIRNLSTKVEQLEAENRRLKESLYTHEEVAAWLFAYRGQFRQKTLVEWVAEYRENNKKE